MENTNYIFLYILLQPKAEGEKVIFLSTCQYLVKQWEVPQRYFCVIKSNQKVLLNERLALTQESGNVEYI